MIELEQCIVSEIVGFVIVFPNLVSLFQSVDRLVSYKRFPEAGRAVQNAPMPESILHYAKAMKSTRGQGL